MVLLDGSSVALAQRQSARVSQAFSRFTDLGLAGWFLWPLGLLLIALAMLDASALPRFSRLVLGAWGVRIGFLFTAIALPGLFVTTIKRVIGRARPLVEGADIWAYQPFGWHAAYASLPSGHAATAFSVLVAFGAIFPQARALLWIYAIMIAISRIAVHAHHPSDVIAGAVVGAVGALLVRNWFAARRLGFVVGSDGRVRPLPGPGLRHLKAVARRLRSA
jgi:undecaprenyl-diphosphatase